jgi:hypothetical protein
MPLNTLSAGLTHTLVQSTVYAMPPVACWVHSKDALELSLNNSDWVAATATTTGLVVTAGFARCTTAATVVAVKRY